jgi:Mrr N-terminal domain
VNCDENQVASRESGRMSDVAPLQVHGQDADWMVVAIDLEGRERREVGLKARAAVLDAVKALGGEGTRHDVFARATQHGGFTQRELAAPAPPKARETHESFVHYRLSWAFSNLKRDGLLENPRRSVWRLSGAAAEVPVPLLVEQVSPDRLAELRAMPEHQYLRTREWKRTRAAALERASHRCSLDRTHTDRLEVHHNTYDRVGAELATDLVVLCHSCHHLHHQEYGRPRRPKPDPRTGEVPRSGSIPPPPALGCVSHDVPESEPSVGKRSLIRRMLAGA